MKSVGEAMAIGRNFTEALQKALRSLESRPAGFHWAGPTRRGRRARRCSKRSRTPTEGRLVDVQQALRGRRDRRAGHEATGSTRGSSTRSSLIDEVARASSRRRRRADADAAAAGQAARASPTRRSAALRGDARGTVVRGVRHALGVRPVFKTVDTCAAEFAARRRTTTRLRRGDRGRAAQRDRPVIILGSGPNRIGQGIEFDYSCVHAASRCARPGYETVMVNCNPETVSTDYDTSDRLYFEPLTFEDVLEVYHAERAAGPVAGVIVQLGGQTPLRSRRRSADAGVPILGTSPEAIDPAEDRGAFGQVLAEAGPAGAALRHGDHRPTRPARSPRGSATRCWCGRPTCSAGAAWRSSTTTTSLARLRRPRRTRASRPSTRCSSTASSTTPIEIDVDALCDGTELYLGGVMEHIEEAGIHSGDSACVLPPVTLAAATSSGSALRTEAIAAGVGVRGLLNVQFALEADVLYVLEANPRATRTVPFVVQGHRVPLAKAAALVMAGATIAELRAEGLLPADGRRRHAAASTRRSRSRRRCCRSSGSAPATAWSSTPARPGDALDRRGHGLRRRLPDGVRQVAGRGVRRAADRRARCSSRSPTATSGSIVFPVKRLADLGFEILATEGTAEVLHRNGIAATRGPQVLDGPRARRRADDRRPHHRRRGRPWS